MTMLRRPGGFTLIELLVVVAVLSAAALLAFGVVTEDRAQIRYDDTRLRLQSVHRALLGRLGPAQGDGIGGFVADNGDLPADLLTLLQGGSLTAQGASQPLFDPQPDTTTCANNGGETALTDASALLIKGHRGDYLGGLAFNGAFRDGWGNENGDSTVDALNFGWSLTVDSIARSFTLESLGTDNTVGGTDYYAADRSLFVAATDWLVPLAGWTVKVYNYGADIPARNLSASLLVFRNDTSGGRWLRYSTATTANVCLDGTGDGLVGGVPCPQSTTLSFSAGCFPGDAASGHDKIPQGRHLLVLVRDADGTPYNADDAVETTAAGKPVVAQVNAVAGFALPDARLEIR